MHASIQKVPVRYRTDRPWTQEIVSLVKDIATTPMNTMVALAFVVFAAVSVMSMATVASMEMAGLEEAPIYANGSLHQKNNVAYQASAQGQVLGLSDSNVYSLSYQLSDYNGNYGAAVYYTAPNIAAVSMTANGNVFGANASGYTETGLSLEKNSTTTFTMNTGSETLVMGLRAPSTPPIAGIATVLTSTTPTFLNPANFSLVNGNWGGDILYSVPTGGCGKITVNGNAFGPSCAGTSGSIPTGHNLKPGTQYTFLLTLNGVEFSKLVVVGPTTGSGLTPGQGTGTDNTTSAGNQNFTSLTITNPSALNSRLPDGVVNTAQTIQFTAANGTPAADGTYEWKFATTRPECGQAQVVNQDLGQLFVQTNRTGLFTCTPATVGQHFIYVQVKDTVNAIYPLASVGGFAQYTWNTLQTTGNLPGANNGVTVKLFKGNQELSSSANTVVEAGQQLTVQYQVNSGVASPVTVSLGIDQEYDPARGFFSNNIKQLTQSGPTGSYNYTTTLTETYGGAPLNLSGYCLRFAVVVQGNALQSGTSPRFCYRIDGLSFTSTPPSIASGQSATLAWTASGSQTKCTVRTAGLNGITIVNNRSIVTGPNSESVKPTSTTEYGLTCIGGSGIVSNTLFTRVEVGGSGTTLPVNLDSATAIIPISPIASGADAGKFNVDLTLKGNGFAQAARVAFSGPGCNTCAVNLNPITVGSDGKDIIRYTTGLILAPGEYNINFVNANGNIISNTKTIVVQAGAGSTGDTLRLLSTGLSGGNQLPFAVVGQDYSFTFYASGGVKPYKWNLQFGSSTPGTSSNYCGPNVVSASSTDGDSKFTIRCRIDTLLTSATISIGVSLTDAAGNRYPVNENFQTYVLNFLPTQFQLPGADLGMNVEVYKSGVRLQPDINGADANVTTSDTVEARWNPSGFPEPQAGEQVTTELYLLRGDYNPDPAFLPSSELLAKFPVSSRTGNKFYPLSEVINTVDGQLFQLYNRCVKFMILSRWDVMVTPDEGYTARAFGTSERFCINQVYDAQFTANPSTVAAGNDVTLSWTISGAGANGSCKIFDVTNSNPSLQPQVGATGGLSGSITHKPQQNTRYYLSCVVDNATSNAIAVNKYIDVTVTGAGQNTVLAITEPQTSNNTLEFIVGQTKSYTFKATAGGTVATGGSWSIPSGALPATFNLTNAGVLTATPSTQGTFNAVPVTFTLNGQSVTKNYQVVISAATSAIVINPSVLPAGIVGAGYNVQLSAGAIAGTWSLQSGSLPNGVNLSSAGLIAGTPNTAGTASFAVKFTGSNGQVATKDYTITVSSGSSGSVTINPATLPAGLVASPYTQQLSVTPTQTGSWSLQSGSLPNGVNLSSAGLIAGTPNTAGTFSPVIKFTGSNGQTATASYSITISAAVSNSFTLSSVSGTNQTITAGNTANFTIKATAGSGYVGSTTVPVTCTNFDTVNITVYCPNQINIGGTATLTAVVKATAPSATYPITLGSSATSLAAPLTVNLFVQGTSGTTGGDFSLSISPNTQTVTSGQQATYYVTATRIGGFAGTITLSSSGSSLNGTTLTPGNDTVVLMRTAPAAGQTQSFSVTGTSGSITRTANASLSASQSAQSINYNLSPATQNTQMGSNGTASAVITYTPSSVPAGQTIVLSSNSPSCIGLSQTNMTNTTGSVNITATFYCIGTFTISGNPASNSGASSVQVTVGNPQTVDFGVTGTGVNGAITGAVTAGQSTTVTVNTKNLTNGPVTMYVTGLPSSISVSNFGSFNIPANTTNGSQTITFTTSSSVAANTYNFTITGTSNGLTKNFPGTLAVSSAGGGTGGNPSFALSLSPANFQIAAGQTATFTAGISSSQNLTSGVGLSVTSSSGLTPTLSVNNISQGQFSTITVTTSPTTQPGTYSFTLTGTSSGVTQTAQFSITVSAGGPNITSFYANDQFGNRVVTTTTNNAGASGFAQGGNFLIGWVTDDTSNVCTLVNTNNGTTLVSNGSYLGSYSVTVNAGNSKTYRLTCTRNGSSVYRELTIFGQ